MNAAVGQRYSEEYPPDSVAVRAARRFVSDSPAAAGVDKDLLQVATSEVVSNAVLHARTPFEVSVERLEDGVRVEVADGSVAVPRSRQVDTSSVTGRGLMIVAAVALRWGVELTGQGKVVWFVMGWADA